MRLVFVLTVLLLVACEKNKPAEPAKPAPTTTNPGPASALAPPAAQPPAAAPVAPAAPTAPAAPKFDVEALRGFTYRSEAGNRVSFTRDRRVEIAREGGAVVTRGEKAEAEGDMVVYAVVGSGAKASFKVDADLQKIVGGEPPETFTAMPAMNPDGQTYVSDTGVTLKFSGAKASYSHASEKQPWTGTDVKYEGARITVNEVHAKVTVGRVYAVENGGMRLIDSTPAQMAATFLLKEAAKP